jgi:hypothetical protein
MYTDDTICICICRSTIMKRLLIPALYPLLRIRVIDNGIMDAFGDVAHITLRNIHDLMLNLPLYGKSNSLFPGMESL